MICLHHLQRCFAHLLLFILTIFVYVVIINEGFFLLYIYMQIYIHMHECSVAQLCLTLWDFMDCSPSGSSVHGISQARILERVTISYSRGSSRPRDQTCISCIGRGILYHWATRETSVQVGEPQNRDFLLLGVREGSLKRTSPSRLPT